MSADNDVLIAAERVSKKFCRDLKRSLWYGVQDLCGELTGSGNSNRLALRKDEFLAVDDVSFQVRRGECVGLIGPNGAGKSTLLKMLNGLFKPDAGRIRVGGRVGALIELGAGFNPLLTGRENIYANAAVLGMGKKEVDKRLDEIIDFAELDKYVEMPLKSYSSGMRVRLGFAVASHTRPDVFLIDEVLAVGDISFRMKCINHIRKLAEEGTSLILVTHNMNNILRTCNRVLVTANGRCVFDGNCGEAISAYEQVMFGPSDATDREGRSNDAWIEQVTITAEDGRPSTAIPQGGSLVAHIRLGCRSRIEDARLTVAIDSPAFGVLGGFSTRAANFQFHLEPPETCIVCHLPQIPLQQGAYHVNMSLYGPEVDQFYDRRAPAGQFRVDGPLPETLGFGEYGLLKLNYSFQNAKAAV